MLNCSAHWSALQLDPPDEVMTLGRCNKVPSEEPIDQRLGHDQSTFHGKDAEVPTMRKLETLRLQARSRTNLDERVTGPDAHVQSPRRLPPPFRQKCTKTVPTDIRKPGTLHVQSLGAHYVFVHRQAVLHRICPAEYISL